MECTSSSTCRRLGAGVLLAALAGALPVLAQTPPGEAPAPAASAAAATPTASTAPPASAMNLVQVIEHLGARGFTDIREVERKGDKLFEVKTRDPKGQRVELLVDARSGEVLRSKRDD